MSVNELDLIFAPELQLAVVLWIGACLGSFANVLIARLPEDMSVITPRSRCPKCERRIAWYENIPIASYCILRGRCAGCKSSIPIRYLIVEILMAALAGGLWLKLGLSWQTLAWLLLNTGLLAIIFLDIDHWWVPDKITYPCTAIAIGAAFLPGGIGPIHALWGLLPALLVYIVAKVFEKLMRKEGLGFGDIKLLILLGLLLGTENGLALLFLAAVQGTIIGGLVIVLGGHEQQKDEKVQTENDDDFVPHPRAIPFGPFLILGAWQVFFLPDFFATIPQKITLFLLQTFL
ncbi:MAG: prepilin peptidase [Myxococcota bacterium]|jgi:leader peptidase (prepilin peptidase)/N-methyltransferase|nr:prepilin peptidase [Myxococcota bacterium]